MGISLSGIRLSSTGKIHELNLSRMVIPDIFCETRLLVGQQAQAFTAAALPPCRVV